MRAPAALLSLPLLIGAAASVVFVDRVDASFPFTCAAASLMLLIAAAGWAVQDEAAGCVTAVVAGCLSSGLALGATAARAAYAPPLLAWFDSTAPPGPVVIEGVLQEDAVQTRYGVSIAVRVTHVETAGPGTAARRFEQQGGVRLSVSGAYAALHAARWRKGRTVRAPALLRHPAIYLNPGGSDERRALARRGTVLVGGVKSAALVEIVRRGTVIDETAGAVRAWTRERLARYVPESGGVAAAVLIGDRSGLSADDERRLQEAGTYHVIAISGGNIAILTGVCLVLLQALRVPAQAAATLTIAVLLIYGYLVAPSPSVQRAILAAVVYLAGRAIDQRGAPTNVLAVAAVVAIGYAPVAIADPGFLLSFGATFGILTAVPRLLSARAVPRGLRLAAGMLVATVAAEVTLLPIAAAFFSRVTVNGLLLNFAAIPLMTVVQCGSLILLAVSAHAELAGAIGLVVHASATALLDSARFTDVAPWFSRDVLPPAWWLVALYYSGAALWIWNTGRSRLGRVVWASAALGIVVGHPRTSRDALLPAPAGWLRVAFLDVGQGDSTLVVAPDGRALLVDAGGFPIPALQDAETGGPRFDIGERVVTPAVRALGVRRLDTLVVTHGDPDHIGGAAAVMRALAPRAIVEGIPVPSHPPLQSLMQDGDSLGAEWRIVTPGHVTRWRTLSFRVLHPPQPDWERQRVRNEDSVVLELSFGNVTIVLPGDVGAVGEAAALAHARPSSLLLLKAAHHGSATSSSPPLLTALRPRVVIFSAGRANRFGHPSPAVVARVRRTGAEMFSTASDGCIVVDTDGSVVVIRTWAGRELQFAAPTARLP